MQLLIIVKPSFQGIIFYSIFISCFIKGSFTYYYVIKGGGGNVIFALDNGREGGGLETDKY